MNYISIVRCMVSTLVGVPFLLFSSSSYGGSSQFTDSLFATKQESLRQNYSVIKLKSSLLIQRLEALRPITVDATVRIVESFFNSGSFREKGDTAQLGLDGGIIQIDGLAPDRKYIADYINAIESDHIGKVELNLIAPELLNGKGSFQFSISVIVGAIGSDIQSTADRFTPMTPEIFVFEPSQFHAYSGKDISKLGAEKLGLDKNEFNRRRIGMVQLARGVDIFVDELTLPNNIEYEFVDADSGNTLQTIYSGQAGASSFRFTGTGTIYVTDKLSCHGDTTRKYVLQGRKLVETPQPLFYVGKDSRVVGNVKLFLDVDGKQQIATLQDGTVVTVIGRASKNGGNTLLIRTPIGLTGWILEWGSSGGNLMMDACG